MSLRHSTNELGSECYSTPKFTDSEQLPDYLTLADGRRVEVLGTGVDPSTNSKYYLCQEVDHCYSHQYILIPYPKSKHVKQAHLE